jgi:N-acetylmuramoyl-L-alanine amidase
MILLRILSRCNPYPDDASKFSRIDAIIRPAPGGFGMGRAAGKVCLQGMLVFWYRINMMLKKRLAIGCLILLIAGCAAPPKRKIDLLYRGLQEFLPPFDSSLLRGRVVLIDPGHGGRFRGTTGRDSLEEASVNLGVALYLGGLLREAGAEVHFTRSADRDFLTPADSSVAADLARRAAIADSIQPDILVSIHHNARNDRNADVNEVETYYRFGDPASRDLAFAVHRHLMRNLGIGSGEVKQGNYFILRSVHVPAILGEASYLSNPRVEEKLRISDKQRLEAEAYFLGIVDYFERGTPRLAPVSPGDTTVAEVPVVAFSARDVGGLGIDPDAVHMELDGLPVQARSNAAGDLVTYALPWDSPNADYAVTLRVTNIMGNSSPIARMRFAINLPPENALFSGVPPGIPRRGGTIRERVLLLDRRGLKIAEGTGVSISTSAGDAPASVRVRNGFAEFPLTVPPGTDEVKITVSCMGVAFDHTISAEASSSPLTRIVIVDGKTGAPINDASIRSGDSLIQSGSRGGDYFIRSSPPAGHLAVRAPGYEPIDSPWPPPDTISMRPWFDGVLHGTRLFMDPRGEAAGAIAGKLGLQASYVNLEVARYLAGYLREAGARVLLSRTNEETPTPQNIVAMTNRFHADRYIEIRHGFDPGNSSAEPTALRAFSFPGSGKGAEMARRVARVAASICSIDTVEIGETVTYPLQQTACPAVIVQLPNITEIQEELRLDKPWYLRLQAYALFEGILAHFGADIDGSIEVVIADDDPSNWLITLDDTWRLLTTDKGEAVFYGVREGDHEVSAAKHALRITKEIVTTKGAKGRLVIKP